MSFSLTFFSTGAKACTIDLMNSLQVTWGLVTEDRGGMRLEKYRLVQKYLNDLQASIPTTSQSIRGKLDKLSYHEKYQRLDYQIMNGGDAAADMAEGINLLVEIVEKNSIEDPDYFTFGNISQEASLLADFYRELIYMNHGGALNDLADKGLLERPNHFRSYQTGCKFVAGKLFDILKDLTIEISININLLDEGEFGSLSEKKMRSFLSYQ